MNKELKRLYTLLLSNDTEIKKIAKKVYPCGCVVIKIDGVRTWHTPGFSPIGCDYEIPSIPLPIHDTIVLACVKTILQGCSNYDTIL